MAPFTGRAQSDALKKMMLDEMASPGGAEDVRPAPKPWMGMGELRRQDEAQVKEQDHWGRVNDEPLQAPGIDLPAGLGGDQLTAIRGDPRLLTIDPIDFLAPGGGSMGSLLSERGAFSGVPRGMAGFGTKVARRRMHPEDLALPAKGPAHVPPPEPPPTVFKPSTAEQMARNAEDLGPMPARGPDINLSPEDAAARYLDLEDRNAITEQAYGMLKRKNAAGAGKTEIQRLWDAIWEGAKK